MNLFDIVGPVMVGPSSSHTAGAVRIGQVSRHLLGESVKEAKILLHGSFLATGKGHGTDKALVAGLLGMAADDIRIPDSFDIAKESGVKFEIGKIQLLLVGESGRNLEIVACSLGGGRIKICTIDGLEANFSGEYTTLVVHNDDQPGHVAEVTSMLAHKSVNIATMQLYRDHRGGSAVMVIECDKEIPEEGLNFLERLEGIQKVTYLAKMKEQEQKNRNVNYGKQFYMMI